MMSAYIFQILGVIVIIGACNNWDWYWKNKYGQWFIRIFGERGSRYALIVIGLGIILFGVSLLFAPPKVFRDPPSSF